MNVSQFDLNELDSKIAKERYKDLTVSSPQTYHPIDKVLSHMQLVVINNGLTYVIA